MTGGLPVAPRQCDDFGEILLPILSGCQFEKLTKKY